MILIDKQIGETPLSALKRLRRRYPEYKDVRLSYAGRLDPMASGLLLVLEGEENDQREKYLRLDKKYEFQLLFGAATDTYDILGLAEDVRKEPILVDKQAVEETLPNLVGKYEMKYPPYSSKSVNIDGEKKPLWQLARAGRIDEVVLPTKEVEVYSLSCRDVKEIKKNYIINYIINQVQKVAGDFRQDKIISQWKQQLDDAPDVFRLGDFRVYCSSGTYVRRLAHRIGKQLTCGAVAFSIRRTQIGEYSLSDVTHE